MGRPCEWSCKQPPEVPHWNEKRKLLSRNRKRSTQEQRSWRESHSCKYCKLRIVKPKNHAGRQERSRHLNVKGIHQRDQQACWEDKVKTRVKASGKRCEPRHFIPFGVRWDSYRSRRAAKDRRATRTKPHFARSLTRPLSWDTSFGVTRSKSKFRRDQLKII